MTMKTMTCLTNLMAAALLMLLVPAAQATDLLEAWQAALQHDPAYASAQADYQAGMTRRDQSHALWWPTVSLTAGVGVQTMNTETSGAQFAAPGFVQTTGVAFDTSVRQGNAGQYAVVARQPLLNRALQSQSRQLDGSADMAAMQWQLARQQLLVSVAERYFDVLVATEAVRLLKQQASALDFALQEAKDRFQLGSIPVTDTYEASARAATIQSQLIAADMDLQLKLVRFADLTGIGDPELPALDINADVATIGLPSVDVCLRDAARNSPVLLMQQTRVMLAQEEAEKHRAINAPSLDLVAQVGADRLHGDGNYGNAASNVNNRMIGIQLTVPLFTGGLRSARYAEAVHLIDKSRADGDLLQQQVAMQVRSAWLGITAGASRLAALIEARKASIARLEATRLGHTEGDRTLLDQLNAENDASSAELAVLQAKVGVVMNRLTLEQLQGELDEQALNNLNAALIRQHAN